MVVPGGLSLTSDIVDDGLDFILLLLLVILLVVWVMGIGLGVLVVVELGDVVGLLALLDSQ